MDNKEQIRKIMTAFLVAQGWPHLPNPDQLVFDSLPGMWNELSNAGLIKPEWLYDEFVQVAHHEYNTSELKKRFKHFFTK